MKRLETLINRKSIFTVTLNGHEIVRGYFDKVFPHALASGSQLWYNGHKLYQWLDGYVWRGCDTINNLSKLRLTLGKRCAKICIMEEKHDENPKDARGEK